MGIWALELDDIACNLVSVTDISSVDDRDVKRFREFPVARRPTYGSE